MQIKVIFLFILLRLVSTNLVFAKQEKYKFESTVYFEKIYGHIHENPNNYSASVTTIACGHPINIYTKTNHKNPDWKFVKVAGEFGYVKASFLSSARPKCPQQKYPKFFQNLNLDLSELYYWGRISDQVITETSHAP